MELFQAPATLAQALEAIPRTLEGIVRRTEEQVESLRGQVAQLQGIPEPTIPHEEALGTMLARQREIERVLRLDDGEVRQDLGSLDSAEVSDGDDEHGEEETECREVDGDRRPEGTTPAMLASSVGSRGAARARARA